MRKANIVGALVAIFLIFPVEARSQRTTASVNGSVKDSSGAIVAGVVVELTNDDTAQKLSATTNDVGEFTFSFVPAGQFTIEVEAPGFKTFRQKDLQFTAGQQVRFPVILEVGGVTDETTVTADAVLLPNASATLNDNLSTTSLTQLPLSRRDFSNLLTVQNGVRYDSGGMMSINGLATGGISVTVDGVDASGDPETKSIASFQGYNQINVLSLEAIQEVTVSKGVTSAEVGGTYSGNFNVISRRGTNDFHGSLFENLQNDVLNARNVFATTRPVVRFNQFGGSFGGPVLKDRLFFFGVYEGYRQSNQVLVSGLVPTPEIKQQAAAAIPAFKAAFDLWQNPTESYPAGSASALYRGVASNAANDNHSVVRMDYQLNGNNTISGRWTRGRPFQVNPRLLAVQSDNYTGKLDSVAWTWTRSARTWTSEARYGFNNSDTTRAQQMYSLGVAAVQLQGQFNMDGELLLLNGHTYTMEEVVAKSLGRQTIKFGGLIGAQTPGRFDEQVPNFRYATVADMLANNPNQVTFTFGVPRYYGRTWYTGVFLQDDFAATPKLMLNLGVRYEYYSVFKEKNGNIYNPGTEANAVQVPPVFRPADSIYNPDYNNIMPRVGFAWSLGSQAASVVRGGFGVSVAPQNLRNFSGMEYIAPSTPSRFTFTGSDISNLNLRYPMLNPQGIQAFSGRVVPLGLKVWDQNNPNSYVMQWTLTVEHQLTPSLVFETGYVGNKGLKISMAHNRNLPDRDTNIRPFPQALQFTYYDASDISWYHGWQSALKRRYKANLSFDVNYTWSKAMAVAIGDFWPGNNLRIQDENNYRADNGPVNLDRTHDFRASGIYTLPFDRLSKPNGLLQRLIGGWQLAGIVRASSGAPITIAQSNSRELQRPDYIGGDPYLHPATIDALYLNKAVFKAVPLGTTGGQTIRPGNVGKASLRAPCYWTLDTSLSKTLILKERHSLQFRADMFNATNHVNWGPPGTDINSSLFGRITTANASRTVQLNLRFAF
jgi:hypothetical protein